MVVSSHDSVLSSVISGASIEGLGEKMQLKAVNYTQICNFQRQLVAFLSRDLFKQPHLLLLNAAAQPVSL